MKFSDARWWGLSRSGVPIPQELQDLGWHYCRDFDEELWQVKPWGICQWCGLRIPAELWRKRLVRALTHRANQLMFAEWLESRCLDDGICYPEDE